MPAGLVRQGKQGGPVQEGSTGLPDGRGHDRITQNRQYKNIYGLGKLPALKVAPLSPPHQQSQRELGGGYWGVMYIYYTVYILCWIRIREKLLQVLIR